jgi:serine-type D-Ala-D-Ala carboxypeptidase/endopeptidase
LAGVKQPTQGAATSRNSSATPSDGEVRDILAQRIDRMHRSVGIVMGVIDAHGRRVIAYGRLNQGDDRALDGATLFQIGSVTKVFTSLLLADMVQRGEVKLDDPVAKYLPSDVKVPERGGKQITLVDLATHTSGLPRLPTNLRFRTIGDPYADYTEAALYEFLCGYKLTSEIGSKYEYSNLGGGLLGLALSRRAGMDYGQLVRRRICEPLGMGSTTSQIFEEMQWRRAIGHDRTLAPAQAWTFGPATAGAGELWSDTDDMLTFVAANLGYLKAPLSEAMAAMRKVRRATGVTGLEIALAWHVLKKNGREIFWHNGGTGGYRSFMGFDLDAGLGVVALSNAFTWEGVDDIGRHLLDPSFPLIRNVRWATIKFLAKLWWRRLGF